MIIPKTYILFFFLWLAGICSAQTTIEVSGRVIDSTGHVLPMVNVRLVSGSDTLIRHTDNAGVFIFRIVPSAQVQIIASHLGFDTKYITVEASGNLSVEFVMLPVGIQLGETVITARSQTLVNFSEFGAVSLNSQKLGQIPSILGVPDMIRALQLMPGVQHSGEANGYLYVRGADPGHNLMLYNRVPVYGTSHLLGIFPFYNADHIDRIHFDKSGSDTQFGNRLSATVQALSSDRLPDRFTVKGNVGLMVSQLTVSSPMGERAGFIFSGRQTYIDQIITPILTASSEKGIDDLGYSFSDANFTLMFRPAAKHRIDVNAFASGDRFKITDERMLLDGMMKWNNHVGSICWEWHPKQDLKFSQEIYVSRFTNHLRVQQASIGLQVESNALDWGFQSNVDFKLRSIPFATGIRYARYHVKPQEYSSSYLTNISEIDNVVNAQYLSVYVQGKPQLNEYISLDVGLHTAFYVNDGSNQITQLEPRVSLNFTDDHKWTAYLSYARKSQHLHLITTSSVGVPTDFWMASSEGIPVEQADNLAIGYSYKITSRMELSSGLFYSQMYNLVHYPFSVLQFNEITKFNEDLLIGKGLAYGAELMLKRNGRLSGWFSYTWSKSERKFDEIDNGQPFPSKYDRRHNLSLVVHYQISSRWNAGLTQVFTSGNRFTVPTSWYFINNNPVKEYGKYNNAQMPFYKRTDFAVDYFLKKTNKHESILNLSVYNLFAIKNPIYVILDVRASKSGNQIETWVKYKALYSILPSIGWRFVF